MAAGAENEAAGVRAEEESQHASELGPARDLVPVVRDEESDGEDDERAAEHREDHDGPLEPAAGLRIARENRLGNAEKRDLSGYLKTL